jgi:CRISPR-associated protein Csd1
MLHALLEYARQEHLTAEPGIKPKIVRWLLVFSAEGRFLGVQDLGGDQRNGKGREFPACPDLTQQEMVAAGDGCRHFLVDSLDVVALLTKDGQVDEKQAAKHAYFAGLLEQAAECLPVLKPISASLRDASTLEGIRAKLAEGKAKPTELVTLAVADTAGAAILVEQASWREWWQTFRRRLAEGRKAKASPGGRKKAESGKEALRMRCLLSGELVEPLPTHNKIEGLSDVGGLSMGDALTSFDKEAFRSYGLQQGANAAMSETMVKTYVTAMNHLIRYRSHRMAGVKVLYWYSGRVERDDDPLQELLEGFGLDAENLTEQPAAEEDASGQGRRRAQAESRARRLLDAIRLGERPELVDFRYYALTLSANSGRVMIRDWMEGPFEELLRAVNRWFDDLAIISRDGSHVVASQKFAAVLAAPLRDLKDAPSPLVASLWRCALKGHPIPYPMMAQTLQRVRIDLIQGESPRHARFGLMKAFCNRVDRIPNMTAELNGHETHPAYLCGRILAILARIQEAALPGVGVGVVQRYYAAASATPALVLGRLVRMAQIAHLPKVGSKGLQRWFESQLAEVWGKLTQSPPAVLTLEEQTLFAMGFYHQSAWRRPAADEQPGENGGTSA